MQQNELQHYGVLGMKWGITRAKKKLARASTPEKRDKAIASLNKHRAKATKKVSKLEKKRPDLQEEYDRSIIKTDVKVSKLEQKQAKLARKANRLFTSDRKAAKLLAKHQVMEMKIKDLKVQSNKAKTDMAKNEKMIEIFNRGISEIDETLVKSGRKYING